ncbi:starch-binding domain-like protein [Aureobasidium pullulans]|nr:starch-binding domain-like protein [Aureobasidium pullulans]
MLKTFASAAALCTVATAYSPFLVNSLSTHQPIGNNEGQTNYYRIAFDVTSSNGGANSSATCQTFWGDNSWTEPEAYSVAVPTGKWIDCDSSDFRFKLFPYFSIGNFSLAIQQNFTDTAIKQEITANGTTHISNSTSWFNCKINPIEVMYLQHAQGDCNMASNASAYSIPVESAEACTSGKATTMFEVSGSFENAGESILLIGSIPELGGWDTSKAIALSNLDAESAGAPSFGGRFDIAEGTTFEYKYIMQEADGSRSWECCENREFTVPADSACSEQSVDVGWFRGGGTAVYK